MSKVKSGLAAVLLVSLVGCSDEAATTAPTEVSSSAGPSRSESPSSPPEAPAVTDLAGACVEVPDLLPRGMVPSEAKLVAAAGDLDDLVTGANDVDVTFALQPMTEALYARATAANGQPAVEAERQYLEALKELDRACRNVGEPIIRR